MWFPMWLWLVPLVFLLWGRRGRRRWWYREYGERGREGADVSELRRAVEGQGEYIEQLDARLSRAEEGLEFAERLLAQRGGSAA